MMYRIINCSLLLSFLFSCSSFKRMIYVRDKNYLYEATYLTKKNDTLTFEKLLLKPLSRPWLFQFNQTAYKEIYYTNKDSLTNWVSPINIFQKNREHIKENYIMKGKDWDGGWTKKAKSGAVENKIETCKVCEFRHICIDCRAYTENNDLYSKPLKCNYDPYKGIWSE